MDDSKIQGDPSEIGETPVVQQPKTSWLSRFKRPPVILAIIIITILLAELAFFIFGRGGSIFDKVQIPIKEPEETREVSEPFIQPITPPPGLPKTFDQKELSTLLNIIEVLKLKPGFTDNISYVLEFSGKLVEASTENETINGHKIIYKIIIENTSGQQLTFYYTTEHFSNLIVIKPTENGNNNIHPSSIPKGTNIKIKETASVYNMQPRSKTEITLLEVNQNP